MKIPVATLVAALLATALPASADNAPDVVVETTVEHLDTEAAKKLIAEPGDENKGLIVLDVRTGDEFKSGRIAGAKQIDFFSDDFEKQLGALDKSKPYLLHCKSGGRSGKALKIMQKLGFKTVFHLDGGMVAWKKAGGAVEK